MKRVAIFGATSAIAQTVARGYAARGAVLFLVGRSAEKLMAVREDCLARGASRVEVQDADLIDTTRHPEIFRDGEGLCGEFDVVLIAHGTLPDQRACAADYRHAAEAFASNCLSQISLCTVIANDFERRGRGTLAVISSVAGDRGRQSNYVYGSAKGALSIFLQGLRNRLHPQGITVLTIKPGFVDTPMTAHLPKGPLFAAPEQVGSAIIRAIDRKQSVAYVPWFWRPIMTIIGAIPEVVFKRLKL